MASATDARRLAAWAASVGAAALAVALANACGGGESATSDADAGGDGGAASAACPPCVTDDDCGGARCVQLGADSFCAPACADGNACASDRTCVAASTVTGEEVQVCAPTSGDCSAGPETDGGGPPPTGCPGLASPTTASSCTSCTGKSNCQANGCYGGWWCNTATNKCQAAPSTCGGSSGGFDGGGAVTASIGANGGTESRLYFGVVGDTRPPGPNDTAAYPSKIISAIYASLQALSPRPPFVVSTGDYMFATVGSSAATAQLDLYLAARGAYAGALFPAMGNHECTGSTSSNCGPGATDGTTTEYQAFLAKLLAPIQKTEPYYTIRVDAPDGKWTSKLVFVAANAWTSAQASWLDAELAKPTTYTFVVRHESRYATEAPGVRPSEQIIASHPLTLALVGHTHTYDHYASAKEVVIGNGGAPLTGSKNYGFAIVQQRADGAIQVDMLDYATAAADTAFRFAVKADGSPAP